MDEWEYQRWFPTILMFQSLINNKYGYFVHFPFGDSYMYQPCLTMQYLLILQNEYFQYLEEINKKQ